MVVVFDGDGDGDVGVPDLPATLRFRVAVAINDDDHVRKYAYRIGRLDD